MEYIVVLLLFIYPLLNGYKKHTHSQYYWMQCGVLILFMGLRYYVGGDTMGYMSKYEYVSPITELTYIDFILAEYQPLWVVLQGFCKYLSDEFYVLQLFLATFVNSSVFWVMRKYAVNEFLAVFVYLLTCMLNYNCEILRASIAIGIFFIAYEELLDRHYFRYYLWVIVAILFHDQAFLLLIVPLLMPFIKNTISPLYVLGLLLVGIILSLPPIISIYAPYLPGERGEKFAQGYGAMSIGTIGGMIRSLVNVLLIFVLTKTPVVKNDKRIMPAFNLYFCCSLLGVGMPIFSTRVSQFFQIYYLIALSSFMYTYKRGLLRTVVIGMWMFGVIRYYTRDVTSWVDSNPDTPNRYYFYECFIPYYNIWEEPDKAVFTKRKMIADQEINKLNSR